MTFVSLVSKDIPVTSITLLAYLAQLAASDANLSKICTALCVIKDTVLRTSLASNVLTPNALVVLPPSATNAMSDTLQSMVPACLVLTIV